MAETQGKPLVSVITPAYNAEKYISEAIESILNQTFQDFEYIIIDDASTDATWDIIQEYAKKDERIIAVRNETNQGTPVTRNRGVEMARSSYILWQDADDISLLQRVEKQYAFMEAHPEVGILGGYLQFFDESGEKGVRQYAQGDAELRKNIFLYSPVAQPAAMVRKSALEKAGEYNPKYRQAQDLDMSFRIGMFAKFANIQEIMIKYREHPNSATFSKLKSLEINTIKMRWNYAKAGSYSMRLFDRMYNIAQYISIFVVPVKFKIWLFNKMRNN